MLYRTECWAVKKQQVTKMSVAEMRMLRWICGKTWKNKIMNTNIYDMVWGGCAVKLGMIELGILTFVT